MSTRIPSPTASMRKQPRQARSRATVEVIVQAGARILGQRGWAGFTTNAVAEAAGVSVGSLYQYFPDKQSLTEAVRRQHLDECLDVMRQPDRKASLRQHVEQLVDGMIGIHLANPGLHQALLDEVLAPEELRDPHSAFERDYLERHACAVAFYGGRAVNATDRVAGKIISDALDGAIHNAVRRGELGSAVLRAELVRLVLLYFVDLTERKD